MLGREFGKLRTVVGGPATFVQTFRRFPFLSDLACALALVPLCTGLAYFTHSAPQPHKDWQFDRLLKRDAYFNLASHPALGETVSDYTTACKNVQTAIQHESDKRKQAAAIGSAFMKIYSVLNDLVDDPGTGARNDL